MNSAQLQAAAVVGVIRAQLNLLEAVALGQQFVQRGNRDVRRAERSPHSRGDERAQPLPERPCVSGDLLERGATESPAPGRGRCIDRPRLLEPADKVIPVAQPLDQRSPWGRDGVEEVDRQMFAHEEGGRPVGGHEILAVNGCTLL